MRELVVLPLVLVAACAMWYLHAQARGLAARSPLLDFETAQVAVAARELAQRGTLTTPFAMPVELAAHPAPPWPVRTLEPGMLLAQAAVLRLVPQEWAPGSEYRAWLTLLIPFACFLMLVASLTLAVRHLLAHAWPEAPAWARIGGGLTLGLSLALDPEAQRLATGGFPELAGSLGLGFALLGLALGAPSRHPLAYGLVLGATGAMSAGLLVLVPLLAAFGAASAEPVRRPRVAGLMLLGCALPLVPWWWHQWAQSGPALWTLPAMLVFDRVQGLGLFAMQHSPDPAVLPSGLEAARLLAAKAAGQLPSLLLDRTLGPRGLWLGALVVWLLTRPRPPFAAAALATLLSLLTLTLAAALTVPLPRHVFAARIFVDAAGLLALWALVRRADSLIGSAGLRNAVCVGVAAIALAWGGGSTLRGLEAARASTDHSRWPRGFQLTRLSMLLSGRIDPAEPVMSNLGPALAWRSRRPVVHLTESPAQVAAARARCEFRHVVVCFASRETAWPAWREIWLREGAAAATPGLGVISERRYDTSDGFTLVWLELGPRGPALAALR